MATPERDFAHVRDVAYVNGLAQAIALALAHVIAETGIDIAWPLSEEEMEDCIEGYVADLYMSDNAPEVPDELSVQANRRGLKDGYDLINRLVDNFSAHGG